MAIRLGKAALVEQMGGRDEENLKLLKQGIAPFISAMKADEWAARRSRVLAALPSETDTEDLAEAKPMRVREDEIAWYLFLCEEAIEDPLCVEVNQLARTAPFFAAIGLRWHHAHRVKRIRSKIHDVLTKYAKEPDGLLFEILVALAYAEAGWAVEMLDSGPTGKSPDLRIEMSGRAFFVECKRMARRTDYSEQEQNACLRQWDAAGDILLKNGQWLWFKVTYHQEVSALPVDFLASKIAAASPIGAHETIVYDGAEATIHARPIDVNAVKRHLRDYQVKDLSPALRSLLGGDWAPLNSSASMVMRARGGTMKGAKVPKFARFVDDIDWACGMTRAFDSAASIDKKARDVTKLLALASQQVPEDAPSIIHIAIETLEGVDVERRRTSKVMRAIPAFFSHKPIAAVRLHFLQANSTADMLWQFDETVQKFQTGRADLARIPHSVIVPNSTEMMKGSHWELYS